MKLSSPFSEKISTGMSTSYHNIGRGEIPKKKKGERDLEDLQYGSVYKDQEEIDLCLNCPYKKCKGKCDRIANHRKMRAENRAKMNGEGGA